MEVQDKQVQDYYCPIHPDYRIEYLQVSGFESNKPNQSLLYCLECNENDPNYKLSNYLPLQKIIKFKQNEINLKWPPLKDVSILKQLQLVKNTGSNDKSIVEQIESFFAQFKIDILKEIDICSKIMIEKAQLISLSQPEIISKYQELSKIEEIKNIFTNNKTNIHEKEKKYQELINNIKQLSYDITEQFNQIINSQQTTITFNTDPALQVKDNIINQIKNINLFTTQNNNNNQQICQNNLISTLFQLDSSFKIINNDQNITKNIYNNQFEIQQKGNLYDYILISDLILDRDTNYIFRVQLKQAKPNDECYIYLVYEYDKEQYRGYIGCGLKYDNNQISISLAKQNFRQLKGDSFKLSGENELEIRVNLNQEIYQVLNYPHYNYQIEQSQSKEYFKKENQRFYINIPKNSEMKIILKDVYTVDRFN